MFADVLSVERVRQMELSMQRILEQTRDVRRRRHRDSLHTPDRWSAFRPPDSTATATSTTTMMMTSDTILPGLGLKHIPGENLGHSKLGSSALYRGICGWFAAVTFRRCCCHWRYKL